MFFSVQSVCVVTYMWHVYHYTDCRKMEISHINISTLFRLSLFHIKLRLDLCLCRD